MVLDSKSVHKIFKDTLSREILFLLHEKEALTCAGLMDSLNIGTHITSYHLKLLGDNGLLIKNDNEKYTLSEKGKQAYTLLNELPKSVGVSRGWKITWLTSTIIYIGFLCVLWYTGVSVTRFIYPLCIFFGGFVLSYALKVKPKNAGRFLYIVIGAVFIGVFYFF